MARNKNTPVRQALTETSRLRDMVADGLGAVESKDRDCIDPTIRGAFADSLEIDESLRDGFDNEERWDYLLGHQVSAQVIALEPHSAKRDQIRKVMAKKSKAQVQLRAHLRPGAKIARWLWVASGSVQFADTEKTRRRLDECGITFVGRKVKAKDLPGTSETTSGRRRGRRGSRS